MEAAELSTIRAPTRPRDRPARSPDPSSGIVVPPARAGVEELALIAFDGDVDEIETECLEAVEDRIHRGLVDQLA